MHPQTYWEFHEREATRSEGTPSILPDGGANYLGDGAGQVGANRRKGAVDRRGQRLHAGYRRYARDAEEDCGHPGKTIPRVITRLWKDLCRA